MGEVEIIRLLGDLSIGMVAVMGGILLLPRALGVLSKLTEAVDRLNFSIHDDMRQMRTSNEAGFREIASALGSHDEKLDRVIGKLDNLPEAVRENLISAVEKAIDAALNEFKQNAPKPRKPGLWARLLGTV